MRLRVALICMVGLGVAFGIVHVFNRLPPLTGRTESTALAADADTRIGRAIGPRLAAHPGLSGIYSLADARDAFAARLSLVDAAERSLDVQYYIWRNDISGSLLFKALGRAADRGVRVRLLLDDHGTSGLDAILADLGAHPNIEIRLFNPLAIRSPRFLAYLTDFRRLNRRMHNKSFTVDNLTTIVGGRNVGDEYFGATEDVAFVTSMPCRLVRCVSEVSIRSILLASHVLPSKSCCRKQLRGAVAHAAPISRRVGC